MKIQVLEEIEHIRLRKGMYISDSSDCTHLIEEVLDNALDECINKYATKIDIIIENNIYCISDNGRGLPVYIEDRSQLPIPIVLATKLFSGGKFNKDNYKISAGMNGVGLVVVNALSEFMKIEVIHDNVLYVYEFKDAQLINQTINNISNKEFSTRITFKPDKKYFDSISYNKKFIEERLNVASVFTSAEINYNNKAIKINSLLEYFNDTIIKNNSYNTEPIVINYTDKKTTEGINLIFNYNLNSDDKLFMASVNLLPVNEGSHINYLNNMICDIMYNIGIKNKFKFNKYDALIGLQYYFNIYLLNTEFNSQSKEKLTINKKHFDSIFEPVEKLIINYLENNMDITLKLLTKFQEYRDRLKNKKVVRNLTTNTLIRGIINKDSRISDCYSTDVNNCELYICEGESAAGSLKQARDPKYHAVLPLKGKVLNVMTADNDKILNNNEIIDIIKSIGVGIKIKEKDVLDLTKIKYNKIIILADADPDGHHIIVLLMAIMMKLIPDVIHNGNIYLCLPPLYGLKNKTEFYPFWNLEDLEKFQLNNSSKKLNVIRFKGLGEMNPNELADVAINKHKRQLIKLKFPSDPKKYIDFLTNSIYKRKLAMDELN